MARGGVEPLKPLPDTTLGRPRPRSPVIQRRDGERRRSRSRSIERRERERASNRSHFSNTNPEPIPFRITANDNTKGALIFPPSCTDLNTAYMDHSLQTAT